MMERSLYGTLNAKTNSRKRSRHTSTTTGHAYKRLKTDHDHGVGSMLVEHPTLCLYYDRVITLRNYLLANLPASSRSRRRKILSVGLYQRYNAGKSPEHLSLRSECAKQEGSDRERCLAAVLDSTLVCAVRDEPRMPQESREKDFASFSQQLSLSAGSSNEEGSMTISEIVDFAIWLLFHRVHQNIRRPMHMLCHGYHRAHARRQLNGNQPTIPGVISHYPNSHVSTLKSAVWADVLGLLGKEGDGIMLDLILKFGVFVAVSSGRENYYQLCGTPMSELQALSVTKSPKREESKRSTKVQTELKTNTSRLKSLKSSAAIYFVRHRMFYARATLNAKGKVSFGLRHIHVLNRYRDSRNLSHTIHIMKYMFPRQFGLHNAFTSARDPRETTHTFKDYTLREQEIAQKQGPAPLNGVSGNKTVERHVPKRLRGVVVNMVKKFQILHSRCAYKELLEYYCPWNGFILPRRATIRCGEATICRQDNSDQPPDTASSANTVQDCSLVTFATMSANVSAFCRAVLLKIIPRGFWGEGEEGLQNEAIVMKNVDLFIELGRYERLSLHTVSQGIKLGALSWLIPTNIKSTSKIAKSDLQKRNEIFLEFLYYVFDSLVIPLIRSNFHVTESNVHGNRLFFFRHDIWRRITEPSIATIKRNMFEEMETVQARNLLDARALGFSQIRLLPKSIGVRPIMNFKRRAAKLRNGKPVLGKSINQVMAPVFNVLEYEKRKQPTRVGSALFSVGELYPKLKAFRSHLRITKANQTPLYFVKCDVKSCFDTIPQRSIIELIENIASEDDYRIALHAEIKSSKTHSYGAGMDKDPHPERRFIATAQATKDFETFAQTVNMRLAWGKKNTVFVDKVEPYVERKNNLLDLLQEHVERNIVKIGKKFFRQKAGIPQGSVLSSLLCSYFYAELEKECFAFLCDDDSILLRLIDDFLLITSNRSHATKFLQVMHDGIEQYGVKVNPVKSLVNFEVAVNKILIPQLVRDTAFPYCGSTIDTQTLEITKDRDRRKNTVLSHTMTVERSKSPGKNFHHKALSAFKNLTHKMFLDTNFNSLSTVLSTIYKNFLESAMKYYRYAKCMTAALQPHASLLIGTIRDMMDLAFVLVKAKPKKQMVHNYKCAVSKRQVEWLAAKAFQHILSRKQSNYGPVLEWLDDAIKRSAPSGGKEVLKLGRIIKEGEAVFCGYKY